MLRLSPEGRWDKGGGVGGKRRCLYLEEKDGIFGVKEQESWGQRAV